MFVDEDWLGSLVEATPHKIGSRNMSMFILTVFAWYFQSSSDDEEAEEDVDASEDEEEEEEGHAGQVSLPSASSPARHYSHPTTTVPLSTPTSINPRKRTKEREGRMRINQSQRTCC